MLPKNHALSPIFVRTLSARGPMWATVGLPACNPKRARELNLFIRTRMNAASLIAATRRPGPKAGSESRFRKPQYGLLHSHHRLHADLPRLFAHSQERADRGLRPLRFVRRVQTLTGWPPHLNSSRQPAPKRRERRPFSARFRQVLPPIRSRSFRSGDILPSDETRCVGAWQIAAL